VTAWKPTPVVREQDWGDPRLFLAPQFEILIDGDGLPQTALHDVTEVTYRDSLTELDQFEFAVSNWEPSNSPEAPRRMFKYIGSESAADLKSNDPDKQLCRLFEPCRKRVALKMGYLARMEPMMVGTFTTMETAFTASGPSTLTVRGLSIFHQLRTKKYSTAWENKTPSQIAKNIAALTDKGKKRFPIPIKIIEGTESHEEPIPYVAQTSQFDIDFLLNFARQHGYEITLSGTGKDETLLFGKSSEARLPVNYALDWGQSLIDFKPTLTTAGQFKSVTVRGWDRKTQKPIEEKVSFDDKDLKKMNAKFGELVMECDPREEQVVDLPVFSKADARKRAIGLMRDNAARMIRASGTTIGLPELRAGTKLMIGNLGARLSGEYLVTKTTHVIGEGGYTTKFECRMEDFTGKPR
jgi:uncharacterized protein